MLVHLTGYETGDAIALEMTDNSVYEALKAKIDFLESRLSTLHETIPDLIWSKDTEGVYISCNQRFERFFGARESEIIGKTDYDFVDAALADFFREKDKIVMDRGGPIVNEEKITYADDGHTEILETIKTPMFDTKGKLIGILGVARDITRRKHAEEEMQRVQSKLKTLVKERTENLVQINRDLRQEIADRKLVEKRLKASEYQRSLHLRNTPVGVITFDLEYRITEWNPAAETIFGYTEKQACGNNVADLIVPDDVKNSVMNVIDVLMEGQGGTRNINVNITRDKRFITCDWYNTLLCDVEGNVTGVASIVNDITKIKSHEKQLLRFEKVIEQADEEVVITDAKGIIQYVNPSFEKNTGFKNEEAVGQNPRILKSGLHDGLFYKEIWSTILCGNIWKGTIKNQCKNGKILLHDMVITPIVNSNNEVTAFVSIRRDITEQKKTEQQIQQSRKMEAIGTLAGGIAHDFNNILSGIFGYAQLTEVNIETPEKARKYISQITAGATRATDLVQQILTFSRQSDHKKSPLRLYLIVKEAIKFLRSSIPATIDIKEKIIARDKVYADPTQIHQIVMNLCTNAYHAMKQKGGVLTIELEELESSSGKLSELSVQAGKYLNLKVSDTGNGMDKEVLSKIFEPYFTTREAGEGTGLGLAVVLGIVEDHKGYITADSSPGHGASFNIYIPVLKDQNNVQTVEKKEYKIKGGKETILIVDDDEDILMATGEMLENYGYTVNTFLDSLKALESFEKNPFGYDLIITDMTMPRMTGDNLSLKVMEIRKDIPIILCSGYSDQFSETSAEKMGIAKYLQKPVSRNDLLKFIRRILDKDKSKAR